MKTIKKVTAACNKLEEYFLVYTLAVCVVIITAQVIARYVFNNSISWSEEACKYLFIWLIWLGTDFAWKDHICLDLIKARTTGKMRYVLDIVVKILWLMVTLFFAINGIEVVQSMIQRGKSASAMPWLKVWVVYTVMPLSQGVLSIRIITETIGDILKLVRRDDSIEAAEGGQ